MPEPTHEAWAQIRHAYENTDRPIVEICFEHEITAPMLRYRVRLWDWKRRRATIPRRGPPEMEVFSPPPFRAANGGEGSGMGGDDVPTLELPPTPPAFANASASDPPHHFVGGGRQEDIVPRLQGAVARVLPAIDATVARLATGLAPREMEQAGRTLSSLTRALRELNALLAQQNAQPAARTGIEDDPIPEDIDELRFRLARRIDALFNADKPEESPAPASPDAAPEVDGPAQA